MLVIQARVYNVVLDGLLVRMKQRVARRANLPIGLVEDADVGVTGVTDLASPAAVGVHVPEYDELRMRAVDCSQ